MSAAPTEPAPLVEHPRLSEADTRWRDHVRAFAREHVAPLSESMDARAELDPGLRDRMYAAGLMGVQAPARYGGGDGSLLRVVLTIEEIARVDPGVAVAVDVQNALVVATLLREGTGEQRRRHLPRLCGRWLGAFALSEADAGSDAFAGATTALPDPAGGWVLTGRKRWTSNARGADVFLVFARTESGRQSAFLVERTAPGLTVDRRTEQLGVRAASTADVVLDGVAVRPTDCIGGPGNGESVAIAALDVGRIGIAAQLIGLAQGALDLAAGYSRTRRQFGQPIRAHQGVQFPLARVATEVVAARSLLHDVVRSVDEGADLSTRLTLSAMAKYFASQVAERAASCAVDVLGGNGYVREFAAERLYRDAKAGSIYEGTSNVLLQGIAGGFEELSR